ncbi:MAG: beta-galactosidase, partial [Kineothrix sp.]|nr:beta-galactosidase [Kineothrix sp.]
MSKAAELVKKENRELLYVDGQPFLILSFQLDCDSCYDCNTIHTLMKNAKKMGCTGISLLLYWRLVEPEEGKYRMDILRSMIDSAEELDLRIVLVWFGSYKNGCMHYAPDWVIRDRERFARARRADGSGLPFVACPNGRNLLKKDKNAVCNVFAFLKDYDSS